MTYCCSICIPCFKRVAQVRDTLKSIYEDNSDVPLSEYEVVVSDNDPELELEKKLGDFLEKPNFRYISTNCVGFMNSYYALSYGQGKMLKLHNSQNKIRKGMLAEIVKQIKQFERESPLIFHSNGFLEKFNIRIYEDFDSFMYNLSYWSSWSGGMTIWKKDFEELGKIQLDELFPHTSIFLTQFSKKKFLIDDRMLYEIQRVKKRGGHNKFNAFTVHYPQLISDSYLQGRISEKCVNMIFRDLCEKYIPTLLFNKYIARIETFEASGFKENCNRFFPKGAFGLIWLNVFFVPFRMLKRRLLQKLSRKNIVNY